MTTSLVEYVTQADMQGEQVLALVKHLDGSFSMVGKGFDDKTLEALMLVEWAKFQLLEVD